MRLFFRCGVITNKYIKMNNTHRNRGSNFTTEEELLLLEEITKEKHVIECKTTNKTSKEEKDEAWRRVLRAFNAKSARMRTLDQIKSKFDNLKTKARKVVANQKLYVRGTGGGEHMPYNTDPVVEAVISIINFKTVVGLQSSFDCDTVLFDIIPSENVAASEDKNCNVDRTVLHEVDIEQVQAIQQIQVVNSLQNESRPQEKEAELQQVETGPRQDEAGPSEADNNYVQRENWSKYVPRKLKKKTSLKLKTTATNPIILAKEAYYRRKLELLEEAEARQAKRNEEEHKKKMILLDLEISLKRKQLGQYLS